MGGNMFLKSKKLVVATLLSVSASSAFAAGTFSGTNVDSTASLSFSLNGVTSEVTSTNIYKVDNKVDLTVSTVDTQAVTVSPDASNVLLKFQVQNNGNTVQDFLLSALTTSTTAFAGANAVTDTTDMKNVRVVVDDGDGVYDASKDTDDYIDELAPDATKTVFIVSDVDAGATNNQVAVYDLQVQVAKGATTGTKGTAIASDNSNVADSPTTVQIVFADGAGTIDAAHDGMFSSGDAWKVVTASVTVSKDSIVVSDPVNGTNNPKRIPGAVVRYCYIVTNATIDTEATGAVVTDTLDTAILNTTGQSVATYTGGGTCACDSAASDIAGANGDNGQNPDAQGQVKVDFDTVAAGTTECAYVSATIK